MNSKSQIKSEHSDTQLWTQLRSGDQAAYLAIYEQYSSMLFQYGLKFTRNREGVLDCLHDLFADIWDRRDHLGPTDSIKYYLFRALRRRIAYTSLPTVALSEEYDIPDHGRSEFRWISEQASAECQNQLRKAIHLLPERQKEVIYLRFYTNFSFEEIAGILKVDVRSAYNLTYKALGKLRAKFSSREQLFEGVVSTGLLLLLCSLL